MTNPVDAKQFAAATNALLSFIHSEKKASHNLLEDDAFISLVVALQRVPDKARTKPFYAPLVNSLYKDRPVCLITADGLSKTVKEHLKAHPVEGIEKVIGITKLRKNFRQYEDKRKLAASYDLFLADSRIMPMLPKLIGAKFFDKKKHPALINLDKSNITPSLIKARDSTYFHLPAGPTIMIKIARTSFSDKQIIENFNGAIDTIVNQIPKKWKGIQALFLRTATSFALPFYNSLPFTLKIQEADTPQLSLQNNSKRKAAALEQGGSSKKAALSSSLSSTPFTTLTLTGLKPEAEETLTPASPAGLKPKKKLLKRKSIAPTSTTTEVPQSTQKALGSPQQALATPAPKKVPQSQKKAAHPTPAPEQTIATPGPKKVPQSQKKATSTSPAPEQVSQPQKATPTTPAREQAQATPALKKTTVKKKRKAVTPQSAEAVSATPAPKPASSTPGSSKAVATPAPSKASPSLAKSSVQTPTPGPKKARPAKSTQKRQSLNQ